MTDPHDIDELASAHLDGATSPEEAARIAADPELQARVEELRAVRDALAAVPPADPDARDVAIAAALAAFDEDDAEAEPTGALAGVTPLAPRRRLSPTAARALSVAAVVLLVALLVPLLASLDRDDETATFESTGAAIGGTGDGGAEDRASDEESAPSTMSSSPAAEGGGDARQLMETLGDFDDLDALTAAVAAAPAPEAQDGDLPGPPDLYCTPIGFDGQAFVASVAGRPVEVFVVTEAGGYRSAVIRDHDTCDELAVRSL